MSWGASGYVKGLKTTPSGRVLSRLEKLLLLVIADYYNPGEHCAWPMVGQLAEDCLASERWIVKLLGSLVAAGSLIQVPAPKMAQAKGRRWALKAYRFAGYDEGYWDGEAAQGVKPVHPLKDGEGVNSEGVRGELSGPHGVNSAMAGKEVIKPQIEPQEKPQGENARARREAAAPPPSAPPGNGKPDAAALAAWSAACGHVRANLRYPIGGGEAYVDAGVVMADGRARAALASVGADRLWLALSQRPRELGFVRREFLQAWEAFAEPP